MLGEWLSAGQGRERTEQLVMVHFIRLGNSRETRLFPAQEAEPLLPITRPPPVHSVVGLLQNPP